jgi:glycine cleavage system H protein
LKVEGTTGTVGITDHAQNALGDIVFVDLPEVGTEFKSGTAFGAVESVKAASDIYVPVAGKVTEVNKDLEGTPDLVNKSPYDKGWMIKIKIMDPKETSSLLDTVAYLKFAASDEH